MSDPIQTSSSGNTSIPLNRPGAMYFVCGNKLHCLGGMKLQANVQVDPAASPAGAPEASRSPGSSSRPSSKNNNPSAAIPNSTGYINGGMVSIQSVSAFLSSMATLLWMM